MRRQDNRTIGDVNPKTFVASVGQFDTADKIAAILKGDADQGLKKLILRLEVIDLLSKGYRPVAVYVTNESSDDASSRDFRAKCTRLGEADLNRPS